MLQRFRRTLAHRDQPRGQIAVFLVLILALVFALTAITANINKVSSDKTAVSNAADSAALLYASSVGGYAWYLWKAITAEMGAADEANNQNYDFCKTDWGTVIFFAAMIVAIILTWGAAAGWSSVLTSMMLSHGAIGAIGLIGGNAIGFGMQEYAISSEVGALQANAAASTTLSASLKQLQPKESIITSVAFSAIDQVVDDTRMVVDQFDLDVDGRTNDYTTRLAVLKQMLTRQLVGRYNPALALATEIGTFQLMADQMRQRLGGQQQFPELLTLQAMAPNPQAWDGIQNLRAIGYNVPDNNRFYWQDGEYMRLMGDFRGRALLREGGGGKPIIEIDNLKIVEHIGDINIDTPDIPGLLPHYTEEVVFIFPFWSHHPCEGSPECQVYNPDKMDVPDDITTNPDFLYRYNADPSRCLGGVCTCECTVHDNCNYMGGDYGAPVPEEDSCRLTPVDEVDYMIKTLEQFRSFARGNFDFSYIDVAQNPDPYIDDGRPIREQIPQQVFNPGIGRYPGGTFDGVPDTMPSSQIRSSFTTWYPQLYDVHGFGGEAANATWYVQIQDMLNKTGGHDWPCGWWAENKKITRDKGFFADESDINALSALTGIPVYSPGPGSGMGYAGLGTFRGIAEGGKRMGKKQELRDKMKLVGDRLKVLLDQYNYGTKLNGETYRAPPFTWSIKCQGVVTTAGTVQQTPPLSFASDPSLCALQYSPLSHMNPACIDALDTAIANQVALLVNAGRSGTMDRLMDAQAICTSCVTPVFDFDQCLDNACGVAADVCPPQCNTACGDCTAACVDPLAAACTTCQATLATCRANCMTNCANQIDQCRAQEMGAPPTGCPSMGPMTCYCQSQLPLYIPPDCTVFGDPIRQRAEEIDALIHLQLLVVVMHELANASMRVEGLIDRIEDMNRFIESWYAAGSRLIDYIDAHKDELRLLFENMQGGAMGAVFDNASIRYVKDGAQNTLITYDWPTINPANREETRHRVTVSVSDCLLAEIEPRRCNWIFGKGARMHNYASGVYDSHTGKTPPALTVRVTREDMPANLIFRFFAWLFNRHVTTAAATVDYSPRSEGIRLIRAE